MGLSSLNRISTMAEQQRETWLIGVWPGMGNVAVGAGAYLVSKLAAKLVHEIPARELFELQHITVENGLAQPGRLPKNLVFEWRDAAAKHDLLIFLGEEQPSTGGYGFCHRLLDYAQSHNVSRVVTFAAMASQLHPSSTPRVFGVATDRKLLAELKSLETTILKEGQVGGLNGVLLAVAAERSIPGMCLMGELPYFAAGIANPKASLAVLEVFAALAGIEIDFDDLRQHAAEVEKGLIELMEKLQDAAQHQAEGMGEGGFTIPEFARSDDDEDDEPEPAAENEKKQSKLDYRSRRRIEELFDQANHDRSKAFQLKQELDRLGVFEQYEDRFLDLFKKAE